MNPTGSLNGAGKASALPRAWPKILAATLVAGAATWAEHGLHLRVPSMTPTPFTILGVAISIFLGFRNNEAYNRFWEARTLWGGLINASRNLGRQTMTLVVSKDERVAAFHEDVLLATIAYGHALRRHLHNEDPLLEVASTMRPDETEWLRGQSNVPIAILQLVGRRLAHARRQGWVDEGATVVLETTLAEMTSAQGGCERIKNTPVPDTYRLLSGTIVTFYCFFLPFGLVDSVGMLTPLVVLFVAYALFGLDALGEEVTEPFGDDPHDLPLGSYTETIETNLRQLLGSRELPDLES